MDRPTYRQYIGARYVPVFFENSSTGDSTWASNTIYEPLTIVEWNTTVYISKKQVPATVGNPSENPAYWAVNGTTTVSQLIGRVDSLEDDVSDLSDRTDAIEDNIDNIQDDVADIDGRTDSIEENLPKRELNFKGRRFVFLGDSYDNVVTSVSWTGIVIDKLALADSVVLSAGGYGFVTGQNKRWIDLLTTATIENPETVTDIVIVGGANDAWCTKSDVIQAMSTFNTYAKSRFTNLENISLGFVGNSFYNESQNRLMFSMMQIYIEGAKDYGWSYLNNIHTTLYDPVLMQNVTEGDYIHPNADGVREIGKNVVECLKTGSCENIRSSKVIQMTKSSQFGSGTFNIRERVLNDTIMFRFLDINFTTSQAIGTAEVTLGTCDWLESAFPPGAFISVLLTDTSDGSIKPATLYWEDFKTLKLINYLTIPSGHSFRLQSLEVFMKAIAY